MEFAFEIPFGPPFNALAEPPEKKRRVVKTLLCRHFAKGFCQLGMSCNFAHGDAELGAPAAPQGPPNPAALFQQVLSADPNLAQEFATFMQQRAAGQTSVSQQQKAFKKTKMCTHFETGYCPRGDNCTFAHGEIEIGRPQPSSSPLGPQMGNPMKSKHCANFLKGICNFGQSCWFAHGTEELGTPQSKEGMMFMKNKLCSHFQNGICVLGESCWFAHGLAELVDPKKTQICRNFQNGFCARADTCPYAHAAAPPGATAPSMQLVPAGSPLPATASLPSSLPVQAGMISEEFTNPTVSFLQARAQAAAKREARKDNPSQHLLPFKKTKICQHHEHGFCPRGDHCTFAHGESELGQFVKKTLCLHYANGTCTRGDTCWFSHDTSEMPGAAKPVSPENLSQRDLELYYLKTALCETFQQTGDCPRAENCLWAHGEAELMAPGQAKIMLDQMMIASATG